MSKNKIATIFPKQQTFPHGPARVYYYLMDFNESTGGEFLYAHYKVYRINDLTKEQFWEFVNYCINLDKPFKI